MNFCLLLHTCTLKFAQAVSKREIKAVTYAIINIVGLNSKGWLATKEKFVFRHQTCIQPRGAVNGLSESKPETILTQFFEGSEKLKHSSMNNVST